MSHTYHFLLFLFSSVLLGSCAIDSIGKIEQPEEEYDYVFTFTEAETRQWNAGFADYPVGEESFYELRHGHASVPEEAGEMKPAFFLSGNNHSDDLFMYLYRKVDGLIPEKEYTLSFTIEMASNAPRNSVGIGGSPGAAVYLKAGALAQEPERVQVEEGEVSYWRTRFDKGNQAEAGENMMVLGNIGTELSEFKYGYIQRSGGGIIKVSANENGELWLIIGTDSGFEGTSSLYYTSVKVRAEESELVK